jgi:iron-sulfur cluster repair protein YtfE (RIC family)
MDIRKPQNVHSNQPNKVVQRNKLLNASPAIVVDRLKASHWRFENVIIPKIEQSFVGLMKIFPENPSLAVLFKVFIKFELAMKFHISIEEDIIFTEYLSQHSKETDSDAISHEDEEPFLGEIINLLKKEKCSVNPFCRILIQQLEKFELELEEHAWIEENIIYKKIREQRQ